MKEVLNILKQKKLQFFFLFYIILLVPLLCLIADNLTFANKVAIFGVCGLLFTAILTTSLFISSKSEKIIYSILLIVSILPGSIYLAYLLFAHVLLEQNSVTSLFETNPDESKEFIAHYLSIWVLVGVFVYVAIPIVMICRMKSFKRLKVKDYKAVFVVGITVIICIISVNTLSRSVYFINFMKTFVSYKVRINHEIKSIQGRQTGDYEVELSRNDSLPTTLVVVIGESLSRHHMSLYGYPRNTNPLLSQYGDSILVYGDVISPQVHTIPVIRSLLSMSDLDRPEYFTEKPSLFELFNRVDYDTYLISNQHFTKKYRSSYDILLTLAKHQHNLAPFKQHDDILLPVFSEAVKENKKNNKLIIVHLIGNHMAYEFRYPKEYAVFDNQTDNLIEPNEYRQEDKVKLTIDRYDNSVLYNDYIIDCIIKSLKEQKDQNTAMIYLSDHAEEVYNYREFAGHAYEKVSPTMCEIPFIVWMSPSFRESRSDLKFEENRPYSSADLIYSLSDMAGLKYDDYDDSRSIFSSNFIAVERFVGEVKYDDIKSRFEKK